ncbi:LysR family transcriptional regulator [Ligilactobacillus pobuzihii]|uniref:LysR family transcriptional regulator n=1 Tax=Ligilactobacillus pobuzihii TaxID=449659 RepID=A0A0R2L4H9_9LACO|nr:LysR family transcriptional regulator [Ligilactobacillus pobuzihii]KRN96514.1 LysR family transcriptional regulator [Ligilactobacillus pobuzihii]GEN48797.1 LysR family transcriptional regulator [Ligilactobacillus pobuzihii]
MTEFAYQAFSEVARQKTFVAAAKTLNVTPSAISHSIAGFENELDFPLFIRNRTGVTLTPDGAKILPIVQEILNTETKLHEEADRIKGLNSGKIRLGAFSSVCINWLPDIIRTFRQEHPQIDISIEQGNFNRVTEQVRLGRIDIGFSALPIAENLNVVPLHEDQIYCIAPSDFVPHNGQTITKEDVKNERFILQQIDYDRETKRALDAYNVSVNSIQYSIDDASIIAMVESGLGLGILPELALQNLSGNVRVYPFSKSFKRTIAVVSQSEEKQTPSTHAFLQLVQRWVNDHY